MALHDSLRELVAARGAVVVDDATELRGALDDFLGEDEATIGELNLLVDAVRLGGLDRLLTMLDNGAAPAAAVAEAGSALARDRGSDDSRRASWAVAALGYALGRVEAGVVERALPTAGPASPPPPPPPVPTPEPDPVADPVADTVGSPAAVPTSLVEQDPVSPPAPTPPRPVRRRRSSVLLVVSFAVVLGLVGGVGLALWNHRDTSSKPKPKPALGDSSILITYLDGETAHHVYKIDAEEGGATPLTSGPQDHLPSISPDRTTVTFQEGPQKTPRALMMLEVGTGGAARPVFPVGHEYCSHTLRPGWSPDGSWIALVCTGDGIEGVGLFLADPETGAAHLLDDRPGLEGSPTWVDDDTIVYTQRNDEDESSTLWSLDIDTRTVSAVGAPRQLILNGDAEALLSHPDWSEQAGKLMFVLHERPGEFGEIWIANEDFTDPQALGGPYGHPVWSPDGDAVALTMQEEEGEVLATAAYADGELSTPVRVEDVPAGEVGIPVWGSR